MKRKSGYLLVILGFAHVLMATFSGWPQLKEIFMHGMWNALGQQSQAICMQNLPCLQMNTIWWFLSWGLMLILFGVLCIWIENKLQRTVPALMGWLLLIISGGGAILIPASGFWLVMAIAAYMIICSKNSITKNN